MHRATVGSSSAVSHPAYALGRRHTLRRRQMVSSRRMRLAQEPRAGGRPVGRMGKIRRVFADLRRRRQEEISRVR